MKLTAELLKQMGINIQEDLNDEDSIREAIFRYMDTKRDNQFKLSSSV